MICRVFANAERMGSVDFCALRPMLRAFGQVNGAITQPLILRKGILQQPSLDRLQVLHEISI
jgi:hypothetical protein